MGKRIGVSLWIVLALASIASAQAMRNVPRISIDELKALLEKKEVVLVDVRDRQSFAAGHIPGAINIVFDEVPDHIEALQKDGRLVVTYCA